MASRRLDLATAGGLPLAFALIATVVMMSDNPLSFVDTPSILMVVGGTFVVTTISFSISEIYQAHLVVASCLLRNTASPRDIAISAIALARRARKSGVLALQAVIRTSETDDFQRKAIQLAIDGIPDTEIERIISNDIDATAQRRAKTVGVLRKSAEVAPAMGLIGTLVGLVQMLGNLTNPSAIGPSMALALLTTFYGAILANMIFSPLASKLERNAEEDILLQRIQLMTAISISRNENPSLLATAINAILAPVDRISTHV